MSVMQSPGDAIMSLLILKQGSQTSGSSSSSSSTADKENQPAPQTQHTVAAAPARTSSKSSLVLCSPQKQRLLMGRLQATGSPGVSNRTSASPPPPGSPQQLQQQQQSELQPQHPQLQGSPPSSPTKRNPNSPPRRTIRPTPVFDCTPERSSSKHADLSPIPSPAQLAAAASLESARAPTTGASVISMDVCSPASSPAHTRSSPVSAPSSCGTSVGVASGSGRPLLQLSPQSAHAVEVVAELQRCASDVTVRLHSSQQPPLHPSVPSAVSVSAVVAPISPSGPVSPPSSAPSSANSRSAAASHADFFLAEQLLRARSASRTLSASSLNSGSNGSGSGGVQGVSAVGNSSSQSSSSVGSQSSLSRSQSSTAPLSHSHGVSPRSSRVLVSSRRSAQPHHAHYATSPAALGGLQQGRPPSGSSGVKSAPSHHSSASRLKVSVCTKPLDQILIRARCGVSFTSTNQAAYSKQQQQQAPSCAATAAATAASRCAMKTYYEFP